MAEEPSEQIWWDWLTQTYHLTEEQRSQCRVYAALLQEKAAVMNLTALQTMEEIVLYHFADSLELGKALDMTKVRSYVDVGTGAGFPGLPLKIAYPSTRVFLLEVLAKRRHFLEQVVTQLDLHDVSVIEHDWRTWLRTAQDPVDIVCARASLKPSELLRMFKPSSPYRTARLVYWASAHWEPDEEERAFIQQIHTYTHGERMRKLIIFGVTPQ